MDCRARIPQALAFSLLASWCRRHFKSPVQAAHQHQIIRVTSTITSPSKYQNIGLRIQDDPLPSTRLSVSEYQTIRLRVPDYPQLRLIQNPPPGSRLPKQRPDFVSCACKKVQTPLDRVVVLINNAFTDPGRPNPSTTTASNTSTSKQGDGDNTAAIQQHGPRTSAAAGPKFHGPKRHDASYQRMNWALPKTVTRALPQKVTRALTQSVTRALPALPQSVTPTVTQ